MSQMTVDLPESVSGGLAGVGASLPLSEPARLSDVFENKVGAIRVDRADSREIAKRAKELYEARWRAELERDHLPEFAAMEPESATYFLGKSFGDAIRSARHAPPDRVTFTLRIGGVAGSGGFAEGPESSSVPQAWFSGPSTSLLTPPPQPMSASHSVQ